jgi:hypothetical protein
MSAMFGTRSLQRAVLAGVALASMLGLACGRNRILLDVDVRSFMNQGDLIHDYNAPPLVPVNYRLAPQQVNLVEGFKDFGAAESATMDVGITYDNTTGQGSGQFVIYFSDDEATLYSTPPVALIDTNLQPGTVTTGATQIQADPRVLDLFTQKRFLMGVDMTWNPGSIDPLQGTLDISTIHVRLVSTLDLFN